MVQVVRCDCLLKVCYVRVLWWRFWLWTQQWWCARTDAVIHVPSEDESVGSVRKIIFRHIRPDDLRRNDGAAEPERSPVPTGVDAGLVQSYFRHLYVGVGCGSNKLADCYDVWHVSAHSGNYSCFVIPVQKNPIEAFELLFFAIFGQTNTLQLRTKDWTVSNSNQPPWTEILFKIVFGVYMLVSVVVLINLLIAMMTDTYQRIQVTSSGACCAARPLADTH